MSALHGSGNTEGKGSSESARRLLRFLSAVAIFCVIGSMTPAQGGQAAGSCTRTAGALLMACQHEVEDDFWVAKAICENISDPAAREKCRQETEVAREEARMLCGQQYDARLKLCQSVGEGPYDPMIDPAMFVDPAEIGKSVPPNPYFPLLRGRTWIYQKGTETITVTVTDETREILGVTTAVIHDIVEDNGETVEDTKDWYGQDIEGNVWYFGEIVFNYEDGEVANVEGSFTAGTDGAKAGIIMKAAPAIEEVYRQEFSVGNAEDAAEVISLTGSASVPAALCDGDCLVTRDFAPIEPGAFSNKYYKPGIGSILEVSSETGDRVELIEVRDEGEVNLYSTHEFTKEMLPAQVQLEQNHPNPFNPRTEIGFRIPESGSVSLKIHDLLGREIATLVEGYKQAGEYAAIWDGKNSAGNSVASGIYIYILRAGNLIESRRMIYLK